MLTEPGSPSLSQLRKGLSALGEVAAPRRWLFATGLRLLVLNGFAGLVLPASTKYLIDDVIGKQRFDHLYKLIAVLLGATVIQAVTSAALVRTLARESQTVIAELRLKLQERIARLPITYHESNQVGMLVSRIMTDVDGLRLLFGAGFVEFAGGLLTSVAGFLVMLRISPPLTALVLVFLAGFGLLLRRLLAKVRTVFRDRAEITSQLSGRVTETFSGIRTVKAYNAEEREHTVFAGGVGRLYQNFLSAQRVYSSLSFHSTIILGILGALILLLGVKEIVAAKLTIGGFVTYLLLLR